MSAAAFKTGAIVAAGAAGALFAVNKITPPASLKHRNISSTISTQLDSYNAASPVASETVQQDRRDTIFDRTRLMHDAKARKPWNMTLEERERAKHNEF
ncbi:hypothetical protein F5884DRAFT_471362 [Xylogone sp. PMI_703]|nr:hypothetical protein F5884DRAFT_471362 [Xylogone sp. PMI_703]